MGPPVSLQLTESMAGFVKFGETDCVRGLHSGRAERTNISFQLTFVLPDIHRFVADPRHEMYVSTGYVACEAVGWRCPVDKGTCNLLVDTDGDPTRKVMSYRLRFCDPEGRPFTLSGVKTVRDDPGFDLWRDTTRLYTRIFAGHVDQEKDAVVVAAGILRLPVMGFLRLLTTFRTEGPTRRRRIAGLGQFGRFFAGKLWEVYGLKRSPARRRKRRRRAPRAFALHTLEGVKDANVSTHYVTTDDRLGLSLLRFRRGGPCDDVILLVHGLTSSSDMFMMPEHENLVSYLLDHGFTDVWCFDNRTSNRYPYNLRRHRYTLDDVALFDYPPAFREIRKHIDSRRLHVICHCVGSLTFMMSLFGKVKDVDRITSVVSNSVALTPRIPRWSRAKLAVAPFLVEYVLSLPYVDPGASEDPGLAPGEILARVVSLFHRECDVPACHMLSMMWGSGHPALYNHDNLLPSTHDRVRDLFGGTSVHYYRHIRAMVRAGNTAVKFDPDNPLHGGLPDQYLKYAAEIETPVLFMTGDQNRVFTNSNELCYRRLEEIVPGLHKLLILKGYGHQDVFMGKRSHVDVFPRIVEFLRHQIPQIPPAVAEVAREAG